MDSFQLYTYGTAAWLILQSAPLLLTPRLILTLLESSVRDPTDLETYFARTTALAQIALVLLTLLASPIFTESAGAPSSSAEAEPAGQTSSEHAPHATPTLVLTALYHVATCIYAYVKYTGTAQTMFLLGSVGAGTLAAMGGFVLMFGDDKTRGSRWPFESAEQRARRKERKRGRGVRKRKGL